VSAVLLRVRSTLQRRWLSTIVVAALVAVVGGAVLALAAGARRTAAAPDALTAAAGGDYDGIVQQETGPPRTAEIAALPGVESVEARTFMFAALVVDEGEFADGTLVFSGTRPSSSRLIAGRDADPASRYEFVADEAFVDAHAARLGDRFQLVSLTEEQVAGGAFDSAPEGPSFDAVLVGVLAPADALETEYTTATFPPALLDQGVPTRSTTMAVRLDPGVSFEDLRAELDGLADGSQLSLGPGRVVSADVRRAVEAQAQATWLVAVVVAAAAVVALGQLLTRHARVDPVEHRSLAAFGFTRTQLATETVLRAAVPATLGIVVGAALAVVGSGIFPAGFVRVIEPDPGIRVDARTLALGAALLLTGVLVWVTVAVVGRGRIRSRRDPSRFGEVFARRAPSPAAATGTRFALTAPDGSATSALGPLLALAVLIAGVVGATVFAASHDRLVSDRGRFGSNYTFAVGDTTNLAADELRARLEGDPDIAGLMLLTLGQARVVDATVALVGVDSVRGGLAPHVLAGRLPTGPDEVALGRVAMRQLELDVGNEVSLAGSGGSATYRVVGAAVVPSIAGNDGVGQGGVVTSEGLLRVAPSPFSSMAAVLLRDGAPPDAGVRIAGLVGVQQPGTQDMPTAILNVARVRRIPALLAVLLAVLATLTMIHALIVSIQRRRRDLAVVRALGADGRWIGRAVRWQATVLTTLPLVLGVPLGVLAGSLVFRAFADRIGAVPSPARPILLVALAILALIAIANLVAIVPIRRARRLSTARALRDE
jgi:hypothetical protein